MKEKYLPKKLSVRRIILAWSLIWLGIAGIILPILPGWPFFFLGLFILAGDDLAREKILKWFPAKVRPAARRYFDTIYEKRAKKAELRRRNRIKRDGL